MPGFMGTDQKRRKFFTGDIRQDIVLVHAAAGEKCKETKGKV